MRADDCKSRPKTGKSDGSPKRARALFFCHSVSQERNAGNVRQGEAGGEKPCRKLSTRDVTHTSVPFLPAALFCPPNTRSVLKLRSEKTARLTEKKRHASAARDTARAVISLSFLFVTSSYRCRTDILPFKHPK